MNKMKICGACEKEFPVLWKAKTRDRPAMCKGCWATYSADDSKPLKRTTVKQKPKKATGELKLFMQIYADRKGKCEITGKQIPFDVNNFAHILSKGAYPSYRLNPENIIHVMPEIHHLYDNSDKESLLNKYPKAVIIYDKKEKLRYEFYNG